MFLTSIRKPNKIVEPKGKDLKIEGHINVYNTKLFSRNNYYECLEILLTIFVNSLSYETSPSEEALSYGFNLIWLNLYANHLLCKT